MIDIKKRTQVAAQCKAVAHLAGALAKVYAAKATLFEGGQLDTPIDFVGDESAALMEILGDTLNGMDATGEADEWLDSIFIEAQWLLWEILQELKKIRHRLPPGQSQISRIIHGVSRAAETPR